MSEALEAIKITSLSLGVLFALAYAYQLFYMVVALLKKPKTFSDSSPRKYAVMISARNEEKVIGNLIRSLKAQKYPEELLDIYVVADNCNDGTSKAATAAGAIVFERYNTTHVGKGYALDFLYSQIKASKRFADYDGFFIFDSDNLVDENFVYEMNKARGAGFNVITSYRNSKNYDDNWVTAGSSLWFIHESRQLNNARMILGTSAAASGTGFFVSKKLLESFGGWKFFMLTEDIEFSMRSILKGERIAYCEKAVIYDEQPRDFLQSWDQRVRWAKGNIACGKKY